MNTRREVLRGLLVWGLAWSVPSSVWGQLTPARSGQGGLSLSDQLIVGLRPRRPREFAFVAEVVQLVELGHLPVAVVVTTYNWASRKRPYPFPYFQVALTRRAKALGVELNSDLGG